MFKKTCPILTVSLLLAFAQAPGMRSTRQWDRSVVPVTLALPASATVGSTFTMTVTLQSAASSDTLVSVSASSGAVSVPSSVTVPQGSSQATFNGQAVSATGSVTVTASANGSTASGSMSVY